MFELVYCRPKAVPDCLPCSHQGWLGCYTVLMIINKDETGIQLSHFHAAVFMYGQVTPTTPMARGGHHAAVDCERTVRVNELRALGFLTIIFRCVKLDK